MEPKNPTVFLSYAHKHAEMSVEEVRSWTDTVRALAERLHANAVDVDMDIFASQDEDWGRYGPSRIRNCDFVIVIPSRAYLERWDGTNLPTVGAGAAREINVIKGIFDGNQREWRAKMLVVLLPGASEADIPDELRTSLTRYVVDPFTDAGLEGLLRHIYQEPEYILSGERRRPVFQPTPPVTAMPHTSLLPSAMPYQVQTQDLITSAGALTAPPRQPQEAADLSRWIRETGEWIDQAIALIEQSETVARQLKGDPPASYLQSLADIRMAIETILERLRAISTLNDAHQVTQAWKELPQEIQHLVADSIVR